MAITFNALIPELYVTNLRDSLTFYVDYLGFEIAYERPEEGFAFLTLGDAQLMLEQTASVQPSTTAEIERGEWRTGTLEYPLGRGLNLQLAVASIDDAVGRLRAANYPLMLEPQEKWHRVGDRLVGSRRFLVVDPDGYLLRLEEPLGEKPAGA